MPARIIPDVYNEVRAVGLAISLPFGFNTAGVVGTAERGDVDTAALLTSKQDMYDTYGEPGEYRSTTISEGSELSLVRAGALAFDGGAPQIYFVRIGSSNVAKATRYLTADDGTGVADGYCAALEAMTEGSWGNDIKYKVETADGQTTVTGHVAAIGATVENKFDDQADGTEAGQYNFDSYDATITPDSSEFTLLRIPSADSFTAVASPSTRIELERDSSGQRTVFSVIHFDGGYYKQGGVDPNETLTTAANEKLVQSFWTIDGYTMDGALLRLKHGTATGNITINLYAADDDNRPTGSALAASAAVDASTLGASLADEEIAFVTPYALEPFTKYCLVLEDTLSAGTVTWAAGHAVTDEFTDGEAQFYNGATWADLTGGKDLLFYPIFDIPEESVVLVINDWGTSFLGAATETKKIIWECGTPTSKTPTALDDTLWLTYETGESMKVTLSYGETTEAYYVVDGYDLINDINDTSTGSNLVTADETAYTGAKDFPEYYPLQTTGWQYFGVGAGAATGSATLGNNGADVGASDYADGLDVMSTVDAHVILCAGQYSSVVHAALQVHVDNASADKKERVGVCGHRYGQTLAQVMSSNVALSSKRMIFVSPGITTSNHTSGDDEIVSAAYTAALLAGYMTSINPSFSSLNKGVPVGGLETDYSNAELEQLIKRKMNPIRVSPVGGYRWAYASTASADTSWHEITTVRITDYASTGIRSACEGFIGQKNLITKRNSIRTAVVGFMENMKADQMLDDEGPYTVEVSATRADRVQGIVRVDVSFKPVFAIKYILVTEYVE